MQNMYTYMGHIHICHRMTYKTYHYMAIICASQEIPYMASTYYRCSKHCMPYSISSSEDPFPQPLSVNIEGRSHHLICQSHNLTQLFGYLNINMTSEALQLYGVGFPLGIFLSESDLGRKQERSNKQPWGQKEPEELSGILVAFLSFFQSPEKPVYNFCS